MSSRKSGRLSVKESNNNNNTVNNAVGKLGTRMMLFGFCLSIIVQGSILYYLYNLEDVDCNCIRDWRHNFCKGYALLVLFLGILFMAYQNPNNLLMIIYYVLALINVYAFFTYIGDLNATGCKCAIDKQYNLNMVMRFYRWVLLLAGVGAILQIITLLGLGGSKLASAK